MPAGTIHAIGGGVTLVEIQQDVDVTFRLYDHGRPRELHVEQALEAASLEPYAKAGGPRPLAPGRTVAVEGPAFTVERWQGGRKGLLAAPSDEPMLEVPVAPGVALNSRPAPPGSAWELTGLAAVDLDEEADLVIAYSSKVSGPPAVQWIEA